MARKDKRSRKAG